MARTTNLRRTLDAARALRADLQGEDEPVNAPDWPDVLAGAFPQQRAYVEDPSPFKGVLCTRRAAKTYGVGLEFISDAKSHPYANYLFLGLIREETRKLFYEAVLRDIDRNYALGAKFNESRLTMTLPNGATIYVTGADANQKQGNKFYGGKYRKICIDEAQSWQTDLKNLIFQVLKPSLADWRGSLTLTGTPGDYVQGYFHSVTNGCRAGIIGDPSLREPGWSLHSWTTFDNPYMAQKWKDEIDQLVEKFGDTVKEIPWFKQMYLGEWVIDFESRCYKFDPSRNTYSDLPSYKDYRGRWHYILGVDLGYSPDPSAFVLCAYHDVDPTLYIVRSWKQWQMDVTDVANKIKEFQQWVLDNTGGEEIDTLVIDGSAKQAVAEMRKRHNLPLLAADKAGKSDFIELMNAEFIKGAIKVNVAGCSGGVPNPDPKVTKQESLSLVDEWIGLVWDPKTIGTLNRKEHPGCANHLCFVAGTMVLTELGQVPIESVKPGDMVWTRLGLRPVIQSSTTGVREVIDRIGLRGTPDHPVWTENRGWIPLGSLESSDRVLYALCASSGLPKSFTGTEGTGDDGRTPRGRTQSTSKAKTCGFTGQSTKPPMDPSLRDGTSTTLTATLTTTIRPTWRPSRAASMASITWRCVPVRRLDSSPGTERPNGTDLTKVEHGTDSMARRSLPPGRVSPAFASSVGLSSWRSPPPPKSVAYGATVDAGDSVTRGPASSGAGSAAGSEPQRTKRERVYALTVEGCHEYVANGVLVSNCDAALYPWRHAYQYLSKMPPRPPEPYSEEWIRAQADAMREAAEADLAERLEPRHALEDADPGDFEPNLQ